MKTFILVITLLTLAIPAIAQPTAEAEVNLIRGEEAAGVAGRTMLTWIRVGEGPDGPRPGRGHRGVAGDEAVADAAGFGEARPVRWLRWIIEGAGRG